MFMVGIRTASFTTQLYRGVENKLNIYSIKLHQQKKKTNKPTPRKLFISLMITQHWLASFVMPKKEKVATTHPLFSEVG